MKYVIDDDLGISLPVREKVHAMMTCEDGQGTEVVRPVNLDMIVEAPSLPRLAVTISENRFKFRSHDESLGLANLPLEYACISFAEKLLNANAKKIGVGSFNKVYGLFHDGVSEPSFVLKVMDESRYKDVSVDMFDEPVIMNRLQGFDWACNAEYFRLHVKEGSALCCIEEYGGVPLDKVHDLNLQLSGLVDLLYALDDLHSRGIFHRDIKFANVLARKDAAGVQRIKLIDFNISKYTSDADKYLSADLEKSVSYSQEDTLLGNTIGK